MIFHRSPLAYVLKIPLIVVLLVISFIVFNCDREHKRPHPRADVIMESNTPIYVGDEIRFSFVDKSEYYPIVHNTWDVFLDNSVVFFSTSEKIKFTPTKSGSYRTKFRCWDSEGSVGGSVVNFTVIEPSLIQAHAGSDTLYDVQDSVSLDGSLSQGPPGAVLNYNWLMLTNPPLSNIFPWTSTSVSPKFLMDEPGVYLVELMVSIDTGGGLLSAQDTVQISANPPQIHSFNPVQGPIGAQVTIMGKNFSNNITGNIVRFNEILSDITLASAHQLTVTVPTGATDGPIKVAILETGQFVLSTNFIVNDSCVIANAGPDQFSDVKKTITLDGSASTCPVGDSLLFYWKFTWAPTNSAIDINTWSSNNMNPTFFLDEPGGYNLTLMVKSLATTDSSEDYVIVRSNPPVITSFAPDSGSWGTPVTIKGMNYSSVLHNGNELRFNGYNGPIAAQTSVTDSQVVVTVPDNATTGPLWLKVLESGDTIKTANNFVVLRPIANAGPDTTLNFPVDSCIINGCGSFDPAGRELVYTWFIIEKPNLATPSITGDSLAVFRSGEPGRYVITLTVSPQNNLQDYDRDTMIITSFPPVIDSIKPVTGPVGAKVSIWGKNLSRQIQGNSVLFNGVSATITSVNADSGIVTTVPPGATTGPVSVNVLGTGETAVSSVNFQVTAHPRPNVTRRKKQ